MATWHESDEFWATMAPMMFDEHRWAAAPAEVDRVLGLVTLPPGAAILDLACGPGRHALELARRGFRVVGVDRTAGYLEHARRRAEEEGLSAEFVQADMRAFRRPDAFDAALSLFTSFGYFEDPADNRRVLANVHEALKPGGALVMDLMGKEVLARIFLPRDWSEQDGDILLQERTVTRDWSWAVNRWIRLRGAERHEFTVSHWLYSASELLALLKEAGFSSTAVYGDLDGTTYDHAAKRLIAVARK